MSFLTIQTSANPARQRGGTTMGIIVGLLVGLGVALAVALYVTKVPVPFVNKVPQRSAEQEATEAQRNKNWDPNAKLGGATPKSAGGAAGTAAPTANAPVIPPYVPPVPPPTTPRTGAASPAATPATTTRVPTPPVVTVAPAPRDVPADAVKPTKPAADPFTYFVQAGAYSRQEDAEQQRARLALNGYTAKVTEREQLGRTMYRVRLGPFDSKDAANTTQAKLQQGGIDAALVAVEKSR